MGLAHFPVAFLIGAFGFDVAAKILGNGQLALVAAYLVIVGLAAGVLAAIPGIVDFLTTVPKGGRAARHTIRHLVVSVVGLVTFGIAWFARGGIGGQVGVPELVLEAVGALLISVAGFLGGSLVLKDLIGPHT
jgi:uncharacterized membrane protein